MDEPDIEIIRADIFNARHARWITQLTDGYSRDPMGNAAPLPEPVLEALIPGLRAQPFVLVYLAVRQGRMPAPVGIATCFGGFSTFAAKPLINVHDVYVVPESRGKGLARRLLRAVEEYARATGCCKLTLEVLEHNAPARRVYERAGFAQAVYTGAAGGALFYAKTV